MLLFLCSGFVLASVVYYGRARKSGFQLNGIEPKPITTNE